MSDISLDLTRDVAESLFVTDKLLSLVGSGSAGLMQAATQQLGLGLILATLLITVPPMAGMWFNGVMGQYYGTNHLSGWNGGQPPVGSGAGSGAHGTNNPTTNYSSGTYLSEQNISLKNNRDSMQHNHRDYSNFGSNINSVPNTDKIKSDNYPQHQNLEIAKKENLNMNNVKINKIAEGDNDA